MKHGTPVPSITQYSQQNIVGLTNKLKVCIIHICFPMSGYNRHKNIPSYNISLLNSTSVWIIIIKLKLCFIYSCFRWSEHSYHVMHFPWINEYFQQNIIHLEQLGSSCCLFLKLFVTTGILTFWSPTSISPFQTTPWRMKSPSFYLCRSLH